jgi:hypothetical protein
MRIRGCCRRAALFLLAFRAALAADYLSDFSSFPAFAYNTSSYKQGGAFVGCGPTTGAMMFAYFQAVHSMTDLLVDPGVALDTDIGLNTAWALHGGSYMNTQPDGFGNVLDIEPGLEKYAGDRGYSVRVQIHVGASYSDPSSTDAAWLNQYGTFGDAWTNDGAFWQKNANGTWKINADGFCDFLEDPLSQGIPIFLTIDSDGNGSGDHWVPLVGFDRSSGQYAFYNTVDASLHWADIYYSGDPAGHKVNSISMVRTVEFIYSNADIAVDQPSMDFGSVAVGGHSVLYLTVSNAGMADLSVANVDVGGANASEFTVLNGGPFTLTSGNARQIGVRFEPAGTGVRNASLELASNDPDENPLQVGLTGTGTAGGAAQWLKTAELASGTVNDLAVMGGDVFAGTDWGGVFLSTDHCATWNPVNTGLTNLDVRSLLANGSEIYAGTWGGGIFVSTDKGAQWSPVSSGLTNLYVSCLAIDPRGVDGRQRLLAGTWGGGVYLSTDHAANWNGIQTGLTETHVRSVLVSGAHLFAGTINGLFRSSDGQSWTTVQNGLTSTAVISLASRGMHIYAGTDGGGIFMSEDDGDSWVGLFLNSATYTVPDLAAFGISLFAGTWGQGVHRKVELAGSDHLEEGLTEQNIQSLAMVCADAGTGQWNILAGTEQGNIWSWPLEKTYPAAVDGEKDAFYGGLTGPEDGFLTLRSYAWNGNGQPAGDDDLSARIWTAWDDEWFYLYEEVADNVVSGNAVNVWEEDCIEVLFDPQPAASAPNSVWNSRLTALDNATGETVAWDNLNVVPENAGKQWFRKTAPGGYVLELAIQWSTILSQGESITPASGTVFGLAINQHDNDGGAGRKATVQWAAVLDDHAWDTPDYLGTVELLDNHKMRFTAVNPITGVTNPVPYDGSDYTRSGVNENRLSPANLSLGRNYPNPFNPGTVISYSLPSESEIRLAVYDVQGREVRVPEEGRRTAGVHRVRFDGSGLAAGVYVYRLAAGSRILTGKMVLMK